MQIFFFYVITVANFRRSNFVEKKYQALKIRLQEIDDLNSANALLNWDQSTYMPAGGAAARGRQSATLGRIAHEKFTDTAVGKLIDVLEPWSETLPYDSEEASLIRVTRRNYDQSVKVPAELIAALSEHGAAAYQ
ncbi:MAG: carboxypeptidase M32, partial [Chloroflexi bacterium]|nr:carboxypeptidase M32 [Chloroflexota bacterium]